MSPLVPYVPEILGRSESAPVLSFEAMDDEMEVSYEYDLKCVVDNGEECFGICDVDSQLCELSGLAPARQHQIAMYVCYSPNGNDSVSICGKSSETMADWTLPMRKSILSFIVSINNC